MKNWQSILIGPDLTMREALQKIDTAGSRMVLVVDAERKLLGTLSDGDIRRALLRGLTLSHPVSQSMHLNPIVEDSGRSEAAIIASMRKRGVYQMPLVGAGGVVVGLMTVDDLLTLPERSNWVVIMAGGRGSRLAELTRETPKPMLKVGSRPILETIISGFEAQGFRRIFLSVNYKADQIESYFGDGSSFGVEISYLHETSPMGTAGALSLLPDRPTEPFIISNADLLSKEDYSRIVDRHVEADADATMSVRTFEMQVPFGVVNEADGNIHSIEEKPVQKFLVNAGIYVLSPPALDLIPKEQAFDMPMLFDRMIENGKKLRCHHIEGYWLDIGRLADYERANFDFAEVFK